MAALREAETQVELKFVQQKLARVQRIAEKKELPNKVLTNLPGFIKEEAHAQAEWIAQRKLEKQKEKQVSITSDGATGDASSTDAGGGELMVECSCCGHLKTWMDLREGDGACHSCRLTKSADGTASGSTEAAP